LKIIPPSYEILDSLDQQGLAVRIEFSGRICYKSEDKIDKGSAVPFVGKMAEHGHNSVLEMGVLSLRVRYPEPEMLAELYATQPRYLLIDALTDTTLLVTGSVRAFREMLMFHPGCRLVQGMTSFLAERHPYFFATIIPEDGFQDQPGMIVSKVRLHEIDKLPQPLRSKHRHIAVKFIVNRAVTHEIVRHRPCSFLQESQRYCRYSDNKFGGEVTFIKPMFYETGTPEYELWHRAMTETEQLYLQLLETSTPQAARTVLPNSCKTELIVYANLQEWRHIFRLRTSKAAEPSMREVMIPLHAELQNRFPELALD
jgi:thymidylate synthase (FAD)